MLGRPILHGKVNFPLCLAPMVGLSHVALREVIRDYLPEGAFTIWPTEMLNSRRIPSEDLAKTPETLRGIHESGLVPQILGNEEDPIAKSVERLTQWGAEGIDINMGCPVQKALRHNYGVALMGDAQYAAEVARMTVRHSTIPVSVKLRAVQQGAYEGNYLHDFVKRLQDAGVDWICLHPRTAAQKRRGRADWTQIKTLRDQLQIPVIGNGDIQTVNDIHHMLQETGCDMVMAGRALATKPWLMWQMGEDLGFAAPSKMKGLMAPRGPVEEGAEYGKVLTNLTIRSRNYFGEELALRKIRFWIRTTSVWMQFGQALIGIGAKSRTSEELLEKIAAFFEGPQEMNATTDLRQ